MKNIILAFSLITLSLASVADTNVIQKKKSERFFDSNAWGFYLNSMSISQESAVENKLGKGVQSLGIYGQLEKDNGFVVGGGAGFLNFDDKGEFEVSVSYSGSSSYFGEDATAQGVNFYAFLGYQYRAEKFGADITMGLEGISAERTVSNCPDCPSEDINIDAGLYFKPKVSYKFGKRWWMDLTYSYYTSSDIENSIGLELTYRK